jgi:hypothetical protein
MTQDATPRTVLARLGETLDLDGREYALARRDDTIVATAPGGEEEPVVLTTGSHREQAYWVPGKRKGELSLFPFVWLVKDERFVARRDAFLAPPGMALNDVHWSSSCIACHAVAGEPGRDEKQGTFDTRTPELGVACEACHGPGAAHRDKHRDPLVRYAQRASHAADPSIVQPKRLPPARAAAVCGQCHAYAYPRDESAWWEHGYARAYRAGDDLEPSRILLGPDVLGTPGAPRLDAEARSLFWPDGAIRVGGREYNGLVLSPCWRGEGERKITCLSCHAMHAGDPSGQIAPDRSGDRGCVSCHDKAPEHAHHAPGSAGAACVACHMPKTSYALLSAVRSHRIGSPRADPDVPNACNLCHLDRSLAWTYAWLAAWYGREAVPGADDALDLPEGARAALEGDAAVRVIVADALGSVESRAASGDGWQAPILAELASDPYAAVRFVAARSLRAQPGYEDVPPDRDAVLARAASRRTRTVVDGEHVRALLARRDHRLVTIAE